MSIDEQIVPFKSHLDIKQYVKGKPHPWGVEIFMLCGESGLIYSLLPYQGSTTKLKETLKQQYGVTGAIVLQLSDRIPCDKGHKLYFDNYFTLLPLLCALLEKKKNLPQALFAPIVKNAHWSQHSKKKITVHQISWSAQMEN